MQVECAYCSSLTHRVPLCRAPLCAACCERCRKAMGGCFAVLHASGRAETEHTRVS